MTDESSVPEPGAARQRVLLVTGLLGAGKTTALKLLEDIGWETIDNFPIRLLERLIDSPGPAHDASRAPLLQQRLKALDYATGAAVSAEVLAKRTGIAAGFDFYDEPAPFASRPATDKARAVRHTRQPHAARLLSSAK